MRITISGTPGSGKSSIAQFLAEKLGLKRYYIGQIFRDLARRKGVTTQELSELGKTDPSIDKEVDDHQLRLKDEDDWIIEGRPSFHLLPDSIKVFIKVDPKVGAERIFGDSKDRNEGRYPDIETCKRETANRLLADQERYKKYYGIDVFDQDNYDIVIDTTNLSIEESKEETLQAIRNFTTK